MKEHHSHGHHGHSHALHDGHLYRDLSWLSFNHRVLQESTDPTVPLYERIKFLGIYSSNLDEFYKVRISGLQRKIKAHAHAEQLAAIQSRVEGLQKSFIASDAKIRRELRDNDINILTEQDVHPDDNAFVWNYFEDNIEPHLSVQLLPEKKSIVHYLQDNVIYLAIAMRVRHSRKPLYAVVNIPPRLNRFVQLPERDGKYQIMFLDDVIRFSIARIFSMYQVRSTQAFNIKINRAADSSMLGSWGYDYLNRIRQALRRRKTSEVVRTIIDESMPQQMRKFLFSAEQLKNVTESVRYHNLKDYLHFPKVGVLREQCFPSHTPPRHALCKAGVSILDAIGRRDYLLHPPYESFRPVIDFLSEAAFNPHIDAIHITVYRLAKNSQIVNALLNALRNGKKVYVYAELAARFDEQANIDYAQLLSEAGAEVIQPLQAYKVHAKMCVLTDTRKDHPGHAFVSTGNLNEDTAKIYSDLILFTSHPKLCRELLNSFQKLRMPLGELHNKHLLVSPYNSFDEVLRLIHHETKNAKKGRPAYIKLKVNNLTEKHLIHALEDAAAAGVKVDLSVRSTMLLDLSARSVRQQVRAVSVVARFLEHSRFFIFANNGDPLYYLSTADLMPRNLFERFEMMFPVYQQDIKEHLDFLFDIYMRDHVKGRVFDSQQSNKHRVPESAGGNGADSQTTLLQHFSAADSA